MQDNTKKEVIFIVVLLIIAVIVGKVTENKRSSGTKNNTSQQVIDDNKSQDKETIKTESTEESIEESTEEESSESKYTIEDDGSYTLYFKDEVEVSDITDNNEILSYEDYQNNSVEAKLNVVTSITDAPRSFSIVDKYVSSNVTSEMLDEFIVNAYQIRYLYVIKNTGSTPSSYSVNVSALDNLGNVMTDEIRLTPVLPSGESCYITGMLSIEEDDVEFSHLDLSVSSSTDDSNGIAISSDDIKVDSNEFDSVLNPEDFKDLKVIYTNNSDKAASSVNIAVIGLSSGGSIVDIYEFSRDALPSGDSSEFTHRMYNKSKQGENSNNMEYLRANAYFTDYKIFINCTY